MTSSTDIDVVITGSSSPAKLPPDHIAYFLVHSLAQSLYLATSVLKSLAISGTSGSSGFGSHSREHIDRSTWTGRVSQFSSAELRDILTLETVSAGDHWERRMSRQMAPLELMLG